MKNRQSRKQRFIMTVANKLKKSLGYQDKAMKKAYEFYSRMKEGFVFIAYTKKDGSKAFRLATLNTDWLINEGYATPAKNPGKDITEKQAKCQNYFDISPDSTRKNGVKGWGQFIINNLDMVYTVEQILTIATLCKFIAGIAGNVKDRTFKGQLYRLQKLSQWIIFTVLYTLKNSGLKPIGKPK